MAIKINGKKHTPTTKPLPVPVETQEDEPVHAIAQKQLKTPPDKLEPFKTKRQALEAMYKYGAQRTTVDITGKPVSTPNCKPCVQGTMLMTNTQYIFTYKNEVGTEVRTSGIIKDVELTTTSLKLTCFNGTIAIYEVRKIK
ncbi:MAG: hypothetical protein RR280_01475 [Bacteroidaceae bacterium]